MAARRPGTLRVGELARRTGLTTRALRHYDALGVLVPAHTDPEDGYRFYDEAQVETARVIARLRSLDVPLAGVRAVLAGAAEDELRRVLGTHRGVLQARSDRLRRRLHQLDHLLHDQRGLTMTLTSDPAVDPADERALAARLFNDVWALLERESRSTAEDDRMLHMAHASRFHWDTVGGDQQRAIGEWQVSRVYATLGRAEPALFHAERCVALAGAPGVDGWVAASAQEALARALAVAGDVEGATTAREAALSLAEAIEDEEDREIVLADLDSLPLP
jgi:DNA-binding transcriptional MerR regulator